MSLSFPTVPILVHLLLGSNLGDRAGLLAAARQELAATAGDIVAQSDLYETAAWGLESQPAFLNQALAIRTWLRPEALLDACQAAEQHAGRQRLEHWGQRTLDVDVLFYGSHVIQSPRLAVPHPRLPERRFALVPLAEIARAVRHPQLGLTVRDLLLHCPDPLAVEPWKGPA